MLLKNLIDSCPKSLGRILVKGLSSDTRSIKKGDLFFALKGRKFNGEKYTKIALKKGACAIISNNSNKRISKIIKVKDIKSVLVKACSKFFKNKPLNLVAVTGTNGKTSVSDFYHQILSLNKVPVASIGTLGTKIRSFKKSSLTSPDIIQLHSELQRIKNNGIDNVIIEASSHGLLQGRLGGLKIRSGIFTNFSQDHIDYHKNMKNYLNAKLILFSKILKKPANIISDSNLPEFKKIKSIAKKRKLNLKDINKLKIKYDLKKFSLIGDFQKKNLIMSMLACELSGLSKKKILKVINKVKSVTGRLQLIRTLPNKSRIYLDYAHTPDALKNSIKSLENHYKKKITVLFGCGGERDRKKRKLMGKVADTYSDKVYITDDNPRNERPSKIRNEIINGIKRKRFIEIGNRKLAISTAINKSNPNEIILIAGKGHETHQDYGNKIFNISDSEIIKKTFVSKKNFRENIIINANKYILEKIMNKRYSKGFNQVTINSKNVRKKDLFIAIKGKKNDGHNYINQCLKKGANYIVVDKNYKKIDSKKIIRTKNTFKFLKNLAKIKRDQSSSKIIAITGSSGKTTVKHLLGNILKNYEKTYFSPKSFNNHYGVPLSLCNLSITDNYGVFEIGMSKSGEINNLSKLLRPDIAMITNISEAHIENFKNISEIAKAKGEIIDNIKKNGYLILNRDDKFFSYHKIRAERKNIKVLSFGMNKKANVYPIKLKNKNGKFFIKIKIFNKIISLKIKNHKIINVLAIVLILSILDINLNKINNFINTVQLMEGRGKLIKINHNKITFNLIDESYNANPLSVKESIKSFSKLSRLNSKKYLLLGDMLELGKKSDNYHQKISTEINNSDIDKLFVYGNHIMNTLKHVNKKKRGNILQLKSDFNDTLLPVIKNNDFLMIKGSNATGLNELTKKLTRTKSNAL